MIIINGVTWGPIIDLSPPGKVSPKGGGLARESYPKWPNIPVKDLYSIAQNELHPQSLTASLALKNDGWKTILSYWISVTLQGRAVKLQEGILGK